jgi:FkbM family methyltransferase
MKIKNHLEENKLEYKPWLVDNEQGRIDLKILPFLQEIENGFFIEAGALDGLFQSNTKLLEDLGWHGLLVEPSENAYNECLKNRKCYIENCALVSSDFTDEFVYGDFNHNGFQGLGARSSIQPTGVKVKAKTLTNLLDEKNITEVDFISLDVEGYEIEVLKGIDFNRIMIKYMIVEVNLDFYSLNDLDTFLLSKGFKNILNISNFSNTTVGWPGNHQDYLYKNTAI